MDYVSADPAAITGDVLANALENALAQRVGYEFTLAGQQAAAALRELNGDPEDPTLTAQIEQSTNAISELETKATTVAGKLGDPGRVDAAQVEQAVLLSQLELIERDHIERSARLDLAVTLGEGDAETRSGAELELLRLETAHDAIVAQLGARSIALPSEGRPSA
jgi:hypothetical protein